MEQLTPAQKRKLTLERNYGKDWRKKIGKLAKTGKIEKNGEDGYKDLQAKAGTAGGAKVQPGSRSYSRNNALAKEAGKKGAAKRWASNQCVIPTCTNERANIGHKDAPAFSKFCNYHRKGKGKPERIAYQKEQSK